ncbi:type I restriction enzyme HsdR N-terminal domain-containing protein [Algoriphagus sp. AGSA1]|uniref:type I restriction enzyme HsdR N-terminal domain-containing protein n=1 Tax=Algoriphagus sp. AGSA1 TaxID=2907213 RepID=UPI001F2BF527|nr:type I restriction enzyme HsdR N-terminal domain-containing protein [Algoriphagus sp. AGSA1]MCE7053235.1 type I restriction enzyme HsdR N-terminal domain-containing protein [Algoriphagus sp. AGSA1]
MDSNLDQIQLPQLNLPHYTPKLFQREGKLWIFDVLRKKQLVLTPEEWVRQHWISFLSTQLKFPKGLFALEKGLVYNKLVKRTDLVVWDKSGKPYLLIECKAPKVKLTQKTIEQACMYHKKLNCPFLIISNGLQHICLSFDAKAGKFTQEKSFPEPPL